MMKRFFWATGCVIFAVWLVFAFFRIYKLHANEALLKEDLRDMRHAIGQYTHDKGRAPQDLNYLVTSGYLHAIPTDPFTHREDTWRPDPVQDDVLTPIDETAPGIRDVKSGTSQNSSEATAYNTW
jgi:general secretion pathway protein G